ncbi:hypothetical protein [Streptomyces sp. NPDC097619]|uniref:hypothetical protein n=1 Tax=Streptomyces sp. NPDC097619 TaxID=3157228 RepID=UPI0033299429
MIKKTVTLALAAGAAALSCASPALADDGLDGTLKPLVDSSTVAKNVVTKPDVSVDSTVAALGKATEQVTAAQG